MQTRRLIWRYNSYSGRNINPSSVAGHFGFFVRVLVGDWFGHGPPCPQPSEIPWYTVGGGVMVSDGVADRVSAAEWDRVGVRVTEAVAVCVRVADRLPVGDRVLVRVVVADFDDVCVADWLAVGVLVLVGGGVPEEAGVRVTVQVALGDGVPVAEGGGVRVAVCVRLGDGVPVTLGVAVGAPLDEDDGVWTAV